MKYLLKDTREDVYEDSEEGSSETKINHFTLEDQKILIELIAEQQGKLDFEVIAQGFEGKYSAQDCLYEFIKIPISDELQLDHESSYKPKPAQIDLDQGVQPQNVFMDDANPLMTQVAIYARLLEVKQ